MHASRDAISESKYVSVFNGVGPTDTSAVVIDRKTGDVAFRSLDIVWNVGAENGSDTLSDTLKLELILRHSDEASSGFTAVTADDVIGDLEATITTGIVKAVDAPADAPGIYKIGYVGNKRYVEVDIEATGSFTGGVPISTVIARLSGPNVAPV